MSPRHNRRARDAIIRNSRPLKQLRLIDAHRRKMPKKGTKITVHHDGTYDLSQIKAIIERYGLKVTFKEREQ